MSVTLCWGKGVGALGEGGSGGPPCASPWKKRGISSSLQGKRAAETFFRALTSALTGRRPITMPSDREIYLQFLGRRRRELSRGQEGKMTGFHKCEKPLHPQSSVFFSFVFKGRRGRQEKRGRVCATMGGSFTGEGKGAVSFKGSRSRRN